MIDYAECGGPPPNFSFFLDLLYCGGFEFYNAKCYAKEYTKDVNTFYDPCIVDFQYNYEKILSSS